MRKLPLIAFALVCLGASLVSAQTAPPSPGAQPNGKVIQAAPAIRAQLAPVLKRIPNDTVLQTAQAKKDFVATSLSIDPAEIGLSTAITLRPPRGELLVPGKVSIGASNVESLSPGDEKFVLREDGSLSVVISPTASMRETLFLVTVTVAPLRANSKVQTSFSYERRRDRAEETLFGERPLNFVVHGDSLFGNKSFVNIRGMAGEGQWLVKSVEVTPISR